MSNAGPYRFSEVTDVAPPERRRMVPRALRARMVLGNYLAFWAWMIVLGASVLGWVVATSTPLLRPTMHGPRAIARGDVYDVDIERDKHDHETSRRLHYQFVAPNGRTYWGTSYNAGYGPARVEYQISNPTRSRIVGLDETLYTTTALGWLVGILLAIAAGVFGVGWLRARRRMLLLVHGQLAPRAGVQGYEDIYRSAQRWVTHFYRTETGDLHQCRARVNDAFKDAVGAPAQVLYNPGNESIGLALETVPGRPKLVDNQLVATQWPVRIVVALALLLATNAVAAALALS